MISTTQTTGSNKPYTFNYGYSLTDVLTSMTYPSGRQVTYTLDAADRVNAVANVAGGGNYASVSYKASGAVNAMAMGNTTTQQFSWNDRVQPVGVSVARSNGNSLLALNFYPCTGNAASCSSGNNGNMQSQTIAAPGLSLTQTYSYDHLNRLTQAQESGGGSNWSQGYSFDALGNRWIAPSAQSGLPPLTQETPQGPSWYSTTAPNRIASWVYDNNGNVLTVGGVARTFTYDAENRQVSANIAGSVSTYAYDGGELRVSRTTPSGTTVYAYDAWGNVAAEYPSVSEASPCDTSTCYVTVDSLGSTRMLTDSGGSATVTRYDYLPFGQELLAGSDGRLTRMGYLAMADATNPKYTGQMRDSETTLDWFQVRHMSGAQGRFQGVDPGNAGADAGDPQSWNGYAYVGNNPMSFVDPSGESWWSTLIGIGLDIAGVLVGDPLLGTAVTEGIAAAELSTGLVAAGTGAILGGALGGSGNNFQQSNGAPGSGQGGLIIGPTLKIRLPPCNDKDNNRSRFFGYLDGILRVAKTLGVPNDYIVGLSSYESGWLDNHNYKLSNLWGLTENGGNNMRFEDMKAGNAYFVSRVGPYIRGAKTIPKFFEGLKNEGYNSVNPDYFSMDINRGKLFNRITNIGKWAAACGSSF